MQVPPKFSGWFDQLLTTGLKILPGVLGGGGPSKPKAPTGCMVSTLSDGGQVSACLDQLAQAWKTIQAGVGIVDPQTLLAQASAIRSALYDPKYFDQTSNNQSLAYLHQAQTDVDGWYNTLVAQLGGVNTGVIPTGNIANPVLPTGTIAGATVTPELIAGIPNVYLFGGAAVLTALLLLKK